MRPWTSLASTLRMLSLLLLRRASRYCNKSEENNRIVTVNLENRSPMSIIIACVGHASIQSFQIVVAYLQHIVLL